MGRSRGLFPFGRRFEQVGRLGSRSTNAAVETFFVFRNGHAVIAHVSWNSADSYATISVTMREAAPTTNSLLTMNVLNALTPPRSVRGSGGWMMSLGAHSFTDTNGMVKLRDFWTTTSPLRANVLATPSSGAWLSNEFYHSTVVTMTKTAQESDLLIITPATMSLIHLSAKPDGTSELVIGSIIP